MSYAVLMLMIALQLGQGIPQCSAPEHGWDTTFGAMMKFCRLFSRHPRPQDLMPLVEPLPPIDYSSVVTGFHRWEHGKDYIIFSVVPAIQEKQTQPENDRLTSKQIA